jgi:ABC-type glycerol-3-phosphate transport system substrate-binding protein
MSEDNRLTRREFNVESALAMLAGIAITITGCGDDDPPTAPTPPATDKTGTVSTDNNHTHAGATVTAAQFTAGNAITITLTNVGNHIHTVALSQAELTQISGGTRVQKTSSSDNAHTHTVTFN